MSGLAVNSYGLGTDWRVDCNPPNATIDCDLWANLFNRTCWGICSAATLPPGSTPGGDPQAPAPSQTPSSNSPLDALTSGLGLPSGSTALVVGGLIFVGVLLLVVKK